MFKPPPPMVVSSELVIRSKITVPGQITGLSIFGEDFENADHPRHPSNENFHTKKLLLL